MSTVRSSGVCRRVNFTQAGVVLDDAEFEVASASLSGGVLTVRGSVDLATGARTRWQLGPGRRRAEVTVSFDDCDEYFFDPERGTGNLLVDEFVRLDPDWVCVTGTIPGRLQVRTPDDWVTVCLPEVTPAEMNQLDALLGRHR